MHTISAEQAIAMIPDGASLMIGGFMGVGTPERLVDEILWDRQARRGEALAQSHCKPHRPKSDELRSR